MNDDLSTTSMFVPFHQAMSEFELPSALTLMHDGDDPHPLCKLAAEELQCHIEQQNEWTHNFGLHDNTDVTSTGKMFGVLVVETKSGTWGYLAAFSGKLAGGYHHKGFVPAIYDGLQEGSFINLGMQELNRMNKAYRELDLTTEEGRAAADELGLRRKEHSAALQQKIFDEYQFVNESGSTKSLRDIFNPEGMAEKNPPAGAGECAGIKLLQYAFQHGLKPRALAEFWWGRSPRTPHWKHGNYYACCKDKCEPILDFMLNGYLNQTS